MTRSMTRAETVCALTAAAILIGAWFLSPTLWVILMSMGLAGTTTRVAVMRVLFLRGEWPR